MDAQTITRRQMYDLVWKEPVQALATRFGLSDRGLAKLCERHGIPTPPRGYWARTQAGQKIVRPPLIEVERPNGSSDFPVLNIKPHLKPKDGEPTDPLLAFWQTTRAEIGTIKVAKTLANPHAIVAAWIKEDDRQREAHARWGGPSMGLFRTTALERRRLRLLSALYTALEARGVRVTDFGRGREVEFRHERDQAKFTLREYTKQKRTPLTDKERAEHWNSKATFKQEYVETGFLRGKVDAYVPRSVPTQWTETAEMPFDTFIGDVVATLLTALADAKQRREQREAEEKRRWEERLAAEKREALAKAERARKRALRDRAKDWRRAQDLRAYVSAVAEAAADGRLNAPADELQTWSHWALEHAAELDPLIAGDALETTKRFRIEDES